MPATAFNHVSVYARSLAVSVDFEAIYVKAIGLGIEDHDTWGSHIYELPDVVPQTEAAARATLFLPR